MKLSHGSIDKALAIAQIRADAFNFAQLQSAMTPTELLPNHVSEPFVQFLPNRVQESLPGKR